MKVAIFGGTGLLGSDVKKICDETYAVSALSSKDVDITDLGEVLEFMEKRQPHVVINCAAITDVDACEKDNDHAMRVNAIGPKNIAIACKEHNARMIHISTDYVFDGTKNEPYTEFDAPNPCNFYGRTKLEGERFVREILGNGVILRTAWVFGERRNHFVDYVVNGVNKGDEIIAVKDMVSSPTYSLDLAELIKLLIPSKECGVFHASNKGYCSRVEMVEEIIKIMHKPGKVKVVNQSQWKRDAKRPAFSALRNYHLGLIDKDIMPGWRDALKRYIRAKFGE